MNGFELMELVLKAKVSLLVAEAALCWNTKRTDELYDQEKAQKIIDEIFKLIKETK